MAKVITFSRKFPNYHPRKGQSTEFVEQILHFLKVDPFSLEYFVWLQKMNPGAKYDDLKGFILSLRKNVRGKKVHTIRGGFGRKAGDVFSPRVWSGKPYKSKMIMFAPELKIESVTKFMIDKYFCFYVQDEERTRILPEAATITLAANDGLNIDDMNHWFIKGFGTVRADNFKGFEGQIICWSEKVSY